MSKLILSLFSKESQEHIHGIGGINRSCLLRHWICHRHRLTVSSRSRPNHVSASKTSSDVKMERQRLRQLNYRSLDGDPGTTATTTAAQESVITPPKDFQDHLVDSCKMISMNIMMNEAVSGETILEPPAMFRPSRPRTELWTTEQQHPIWPHLLPAAVDSNTSSSRSHFDEELERLKSHSLFLRFPLDGAARVHYRSSKSVVVQSSFLNQYR